MNRIVISCCSIGRERERERERDILPLTKGKRKGGEEKNQVCFLFFSSLTSVSKFKPSNSKSMSDFIIKILSQIIGSR